MRRLARSIYKKHLLPIAGVFWYMRVIHNYIIACLVSCSIVLELAQKTMTNNLFNYQKRTGYEWDVITPCAYSVLFCSLNTKSYGKRHHIK